MQSARDISVSVLFSEPKIPQSARASSPIGALIAFQCSSASRKFLNFRLYRQWSHWQKVSVLFSEPKIPQCNTDAKWMTLLEFQCSSASRKFLNEKQVLWRLSLERGFSALQRAENSSMSGILNDVAGNVRVSVLFSEPKIPQCGYGTAHSRRSVVSVLFSEPKIPQLIASAAASIASVVSVLFSEPKIPQ